MEADAEAARVHRRLQHSSGRRGRPFVAVEQLGGPGQVLSHSPVGAGAGEGIGQQPVTVPGEGRRGGQRLCVKRVGDGQRAAGQEFPNPAVRVFPTRGGHGGVAGGVLGPEGAEHQHRTAFRGGEQAVECGGDALAGLAVAEVVLGFVQPHHSFRSDTVQVIESGLGAGGIEGMPKLPPHVREGLHSLPACPCLARR